MLVSSLAPCVPGGPSSDLDSPRVLTASPRWEVRYVASCGTCCCSRAYRLGLKDAEGSGRQGPLGHHRAFILKAGRVSAVQFAAYLGHSPGSAVMNLLLSHLKVEMSVGMSVNGH